MSVPGDPHVHHVQVLINRFLAHFKVPHTPLALDGQTGPKTNAAVHLVKLCLGYAPKYATSKIDSAFERHLDKPLSTMSPVQVARGLAYRRHLRAHPAPHGPAAALAFARRYLGTTEHPPDSNSGEPVDTWERRFGFHGVAWCGIFCGNALLAAGVRGVTSRIAGVSLIVSDAQHGHGPFSGWSGDWRNARPGDLVVVGCSSCHVELVDHADSSGIWARGGNTSPGPGGSQFNGGCVAYKHRSPGEIVGIAHVNY